MSLKPHSILRHGYYLYLASLPGAAIGSLIFLQVSLPLWLSPEGSLFFFFGCVLFAGVCCYWAVVAELLPFPSNLLSAIAAVFALPATLAFAVLWEGQSLAVLFVLNFFVEFFGIMLLISGMVLRKMGTKDKNWFAALLLLCAAAGAALFGFIVLQQSLFDLRGATLLGFGVGCVAVAIRYWRLFHAERETELGEQKGYILFGVLMFFLLPGVTALILSL